jgi:hypothetical protein
MSMGEFTSGHSSMCAGIQSTLKHIECPLVIAAGWCPTRWHAGIFRALMKNPHDADGWWRNRASLQAFETASPMQ